MKKAILILIAGTALTAGVLTSCRGKVTISSDKGTDTIEFDTDSIHQININVQTNNVQTDDETYDDVSSDTLQ